MTSREAGDASKVEVNLPSLNFWGILRRCEELGWIGPTSDNELEFECLAQVQVHIFDGGWGL